MCGIIGVLSKENISQMIYDGLIMLQHRGQDAAGIATYSGQFHFKRGLGLVRDIFDQDNMMRLKGNSGLGQVRYSTVAGSSVNRIDDVQPFYTNSPYGITLVHNGNIFNFKEIREDLFKKDKRQVGSNCDTEALLNVLAFELSKEAGKKGDFSKRFFNSLERVFERLRGSYSVVGIIAGKGMFAFRDSSGIRPLVIGKNSKGFIFASENIMFNNFGYKMLRDVDPGEAVFIDKKFNMTSKVIKSNGHHPCIFEYVYFARPDAFLDKISVYKARLRMGQFLAKKIKAMKPKLDIDVVVPVPSTSTTAAVSLAFDLGVKYREGIVKSQFVGRTFIIPGQTERKRAVNYKLSPIELEIKGKNVLLLDDSIVRGNTSKRIVDMVRKAGAKKVFFASAAPPLRHPCLYGVDMPTRREFIANSFKEKDIACEIGVDALIYQDLEDLIDCVVHHGNPKLKKPCVACFSGVYLAGNVTDKVLKEVEEDRLKILKERDEGVGLQGRMI
jgi:amidophosphoribosyltransferase